MTAPTAPRLASGPTGAAAAAAERALAAHEPLLAPSFRRALPLAREVVARRLVAAAYREAVPPSQSTLDRTVPALMTARRYGLRRIEFTDRIDADPAELLDALAGADGWPSTGVPAVRAELVDATVNLALAYARRSIMDSELRARAGAAGAADVIELFAAMDADERLVAFERLATEGHNLHPCARTRLGWGIDDLLAHDLESPVTSIGFLAVRRDLHVGDEVGALLLGDDVLPGADRLDPARYVATPVHPWQRRHLLRGPYAELVATGAIVPLDVELPALVTAALRTLLVPGLPPGAPPGAAATGSSPGTARSAAGVFVKVSLDIQVTSTRRTISVASTRNGPVLTRLLPDLIADDRVLLMAETAGSATVVAGAAGARARDRDLAAILRRGLAGLLRPGEIAVPGLALPAPDPVSGTTVVAALVNRYAHATGLSTRDSAALSFVEDYARLMLPPILRLATRHGIGLEAHLQNCVPTFLAGVPHRLAVRDLAGLRIHVPRAGERIAAALWPGSVIATPDVDVLRAKVAYTAIQAHLGEIVLRLAGSHGLAEEQAWARIRSIVDGTYAELAAEPGLAARARDDHAFLTAPRVPHKALLRMRLRETAGQPGDTYVELENPL